MADNNTVMEQNRVLGEAIGRTIADSIVRGDPEVAAEKEAGKERKRIQREGMIASAKKSEANKKFYQDRCPHQKENKRPNTGGQIMGNGKANIICQSCHRAWEVELDPETRRLIESGDVSLAEAVIPRNAVVIN